VKENQALSTTEGIPSQARSASADEAATSPATTTMTDGVERDVVAVRLPATAAYLAVLRTTTASLAARLDFTLDEIEDLRIAVDEACCLLLAGVTPDAELSSIFEMSDDSINITVSAPSRTGHGPARESFAWTVLSALAGQVDTWTEPDGRQTIALVKHRTRGASA
jgi:serine/threonine-protein kinase RsbW